MRENHTGTEDFYQRPTVRIERGGVMYITGQAADDQLLAVYLNAEDEADGLEAFRQLETRYAKLVWMTVTRCLGVDDPLVGEAVQATFVVFARRAKEIRHPLPQWLRQTAKRTAYHVAAQCTLATA